MELSLQERRRGRKVSTEGGYIPNPYGRDLGLGYRVRTLPLGFLSPTRGTEGVVKTIEDRWGKYSTGGRLHPLVPEGFCPLEGESKGSKRLLKRGLVRKVELSLQERRRGRSY